jgi:hypothetical protein
VPQGLLKKIEFDLLLTNLAFQLSDALASRRRIVGFGHAQIQIFLAGLTGTPRALRPIPPIQAAG